MTAGTRPLDHDHDPAGRTRTGRPRVIGLDVTRAVALIGVVLMNYHGYLNRGNDGPDHSWAERLFHPWEGVLATRFAATFVLVAGMGVTLLTQRSRVSGDRSAIRADRWRLLRRGAVLFAGGWLLEKTWPGTILFFYGAYFMIAAGLFTLRARWLAMIGAAAAVAGAAISEWSAWRALDGHSTAWLDPEPDSPRGLVLRTFVGYTHPVLPWLAFLCAGMIIGRHLTRLGAIRPALLGGGLAAVTVTYLASTLGPSPDASALGPKSRHEVLVAHLLSTRPFDRGLLYTVGTLGSSIAAFCVISWLAEQHPDAWLVVALRRAGQMTLSLYLLHVVVFKVVVEQLGWVTATGVDAALVLALCFWVAAIGAAALWHEHLGQGPAERVYRWAGG